MKNSRSLFAKLALVLLAVVGASGALYVAVTAVVSRGYQRELHQNLYRNLAANLVQEGHLMAAGEVQQEALQDVFHMMMVINPAIEVYLIDPQGRLLAFSAPEEVVVRREVALEPIARFLERDSRLPILGDDPRRGDGRKVFSVAPIGSAESPEGYLYVVLGGTEYDSVAELLAGSYFVWLGVAGILGSLLIPLAAGLWLFYYLTRRLRGLSRRVLAFETKAGLEPVVTREAAANEGDEIEQLGGSFDRMAERLLRQVAELRHLDSLRRELIANVSHDLRTPLTSLQGYLETLRLKDDTMSAVDRLRYLDIAERQAARLLRLVAELFELAKLDAGGVELHREPLALGELVQDIVGEYRLAEDADSAALLALLGAEPEVNDVAIAGDVVLPGGSQTVQVEFVPGANVLTTLGMLVTTNDSFFSATGRVAGRSVTFNAPAYDAGSEANTQECDHIPGPPCDNPFVRVTDGAEGFIYISSGVRAAGDLDVALHDWRNPVARISVTRVVE